MSDFLFSSRRVEPGRLASVVESAYREVGGLSCAEFHGEWGSLAVGATLYADLDPIETDRFILAVVGGPWMRGAGSSKHAASTAAILDLIEQGRLRQESDLSGPFVLLVVDKPSGEVRIFTDLLAFIPVFRTNTRDDSTRIVLGSHVDQVAQEAGRDGELDPISIVDALIHGRVTFPATYYPGVAQVTPASVLTIRRGEPLQEQISWEPRETEGFRDLREAADALREALGSAVAAITRGCESAALMLSGGADSRVILASIPPSVRAIGFTFTDRPNRETRLAARVARDYGADWRHGLRDTAYYARQLLPGARLVGRESQGWQIHAYGLRETLGLADQPVVLGGLLSDTFLKGMFAFPQERTFRGIKYAPSRPGNREPRQPPLGRNGLSLLDPEIVAEAIARRERHRAAVLAMRPASGIEWSRIWPINHNPDVAHHSGGRKLYRAYEPFMDSEIVKIGAAVPQRWKLDRGLFHAMAKPLLRRSALTPHSDGSLPYFGLFANVPISFATLAARKVQRLIHRPPDRNEGPWPDLFAVSRSPFMLDLVTSQEPAFARVKHLFDPSVTYPSLFEGALTHEQQFLFLQLLALLSERGDGIRIGATG